MNDTHLGVALEYAAGGELFDTVARAGKLPEIEARYFFQQLVLGLEYCHNRVRRMRCCAGSSKQGMVREASRAASKASVGIGLSSLYCCQLS